MNNDHTINPETDPATLAANSLVITRKVKHGKAKKPFAGRSLYNLTATPYQFETDRRLTVIRRFFEAARAKTKHTRVPTIRNFVVQALYDAIIEQAKVGKRNKEFLERVKHEIENEGSNFVIDNPNRNIALDA